MNIYSTILEKSKSGKRQLAVLIDPDKVSDERLERLCSMFAAERPDYIFVGGSLVMNDIPSIVARLKSTVDIPVVLFPGDASQFTPNADAILMLSLISGRNAEYLIGQHVKASLKIREARLEAIPTGYMLIDGGRRTAVEYISGTMPIPGDKSDIAVATAVAGELLGMKLLYIEAGSGAMQPVSPQLIADVKSMVGIPLIVGGGLRTSEQITAACQAGADLIVVGSALEQDPECYHSICKAIHSF